MSCRRVKRGVDVKKEEEELLLLLLRSENRSPGAAKDAIVIELCWLLKNKDGKLG